MKNILHDKFNLSDFFKASFDAYKSGWKGIVGYAFIQALLSIFLFGLVALGTWLTIGAAAFSEYDFARNLNFSSPLQWAALAAIGIVTVVFYSAAYAYTQTGVTAYIHARLLQKPISFAQSLEIASKRFLKVFTFTFVFGFILLFFISLFVSLIVFAAIGMQSTNLQGGLAVLLMCAGVLGLIAAYVVIIYLSLRLMFTTVHLSVTNSGVMESIRLSDQTTKGNLLRLLGYIIVLGLVVAGLSVVYSIPLAGISFALQLVFVQLETPALMVIVSIVRSLVETFLSTILGYFIFTYIVAVYINWTRDGHSK